MRVISASFAAVLLCLTVVSLPAPVRGESLRRPTPDSLARPQALVHKFGLDVSPGALFRTDDFFKGANAAGKEFGATLSVHLKYAFQFGPETVSAATTPSPIKASDWVTTPFSTAPRSVRP